MVIAGLHDPATPVAQAEHIHSKIAESTLVTLDAAHLSNVERAAEYTAVLQDFLLTE
jgi:3-oxoadipate enol-lactonase